jgi:hypothetical protein
MVPLPSDEYILNLGRLCHSAKLPSATNTGTTSETTATPLAVLVVDPEKPGRPTLPAKSLQVIA